MLLASGTKDRIEVSLAYCSQASWRMVRCLHSVTFLTAAEISGSS